MKAGADPTLHVTKPLVVGTLLGLAWVTLLVLRWL